MKGLILMGALLGAMASSSTRAQSANYAGSPEAAIDEAVDAVCHMARVDAGAVKTRIGCDQDRISARGR